MKKLAFLALVLFSSLALQAQDVYWVFLADKAGTTFDPYAYFDAKAVERYNACGADLYDVSNYPLTEAYVAGVDALATEEVGCSRWMNAVGVVATAEQAAAIERLPYVLRVQRLGGDMQLTSSQWTEAGDPLADADIDSTLTDQVKRMQGHLFRQHGINGRGVRIAVFDGGFPKVNTHAAFKHLRDNGQILKTWNFPNKKENVYGWNSHGTMTLSCIAGRKNGMDLGLATGAEFLLARTEIGPEPFKEEVWWQQAVEWADRNGANIISSSLGYGKDRYYTKDMDGQSYVAHAANLAARKGILVVCSAGNEGSDRSWMTIVTPSDADSVLCIGGITHSLTDYSHINFASYGPTADGRQKPNVAAFAHAWAASPKNDNAYEMVFGTSFSCPLVAGFAACAWQASKGKTNMEMFDLIQRSSDLYPYCDYAYGYGVPQASFFVGGKSVPAAPRFKLEADGSMVTLTPLVADSNVHVFYKDVDDKGRILFFGQTSYEMLDAKHPIDFVGGHHLVVNYGGQTADIDFEQQSPVSAWAVPAAEDVDYAVTAEFERDPQTDVPHESRIQWDYYLALGVPVSLTDAEMSSRFYSPAARIGVRWQYHFSKAYGIGLGLEWGETRYRYKDRHYNKLEQLIGADAVMDGMSKIGRRDLELGELGLELFQRVRFLPAGLNHKGLHWDLGVYGTWGYNEYTLKGNPAGTTLYGSMKTELRKLEPLSDYTFNYGVATRLTYDIVGLYARYRLNCIGTDVPADKVLLPRLEVGVQLMF